MARTTSTNFTGGLDFTLATAATDLFVKEDVQTLAQAVDLHDHTTGKGLALSATSIPDGSITSAKIADGTITSADIAAGACQTTSQYVAIPTFSTTTTGVWVGTPVTFSVTPVLTGFMRYEWAVVVSHTVPNGAFYYAVGIDGSGVTLAYTQAPPAGSLSVPVTGIFYGNLTLAPHTVSFMLQNVTAGTLSLSAGLSAYLFATEQKR